MRTNTSWCAPIRASSSDSLSSMSIRAPDGSEASVPAKRTRRKAVPARPIYDEPPFDRDSAIPF